jgi:hypothetical protein
MNQNGDTSILSFGPSGYLDTDEVEFSQPIISQQTGKAYAPKWLFPKCGARFGFGGKLITF